MLSRETAKEPPQTYLKMFGEGGKPAGERQVTNYPHPYPQVLWRWRWRLGFATGCMKVWWRWRWRLGFAD
eukprot:295662-Chlamydomonas_euryale.AAC.1